MEFSRPEYWSGYPPVFPSPGNLVPFSRRSSQHREWTQVSRIAGGFFTSWATGEAQQCNRITYNLGGQAEWCGKWKRMHTYVFIYPALLCLLVSAFDPITIFLSVLGLFSVRLFLFLCFLPREVPLAFVVKLVRWCWILLTFACLESFMISPSNLNGNLSG